ncbi:hypothetical protein BVC80_1651g80 [Macleaya cordata]|uniref:Uncharacterized protein n=1 Tax=Macleaya cordata TaxID=56857 RepID=A0A200PZC3_MACCD|nr:hypothetical protein BVC80_1651g80 [Macleaya cordata]
MFYKVEGVTLRGCLTGSTIGLLPIGHQFESPQGHWGIVKRPTPYRAPGLVEVRASWPEHHG